MKHWHVVKADDGSLCLEDKWHKEDSGCGFHVWVEGFEGCVHIWDEVNPAEEADYFHICDLPEFIEQLQEILQIAKKHFKDQQVWQER